MTRNPKLGIQGSWIRELQKPSFVFAETMSCWVSFSEQIGVAESDFETSFTVSITPDPKLGSQGSWARDRQKPSLCFSRNHVVLGVLLIANRGR